MAPLFFEQTYDVEGDHESTKMRQAYVRHRKLHIKRSDFTRARHERDWTWGKAIESSKPHHSLRVATRTCLAKGAVEADEDMPSISMSKRGDKGTRRKPAIAHVIHGSKVVGSISDIETTADEIDLDADDIMELSHSEESLVCDPLGDLSKFAFEPLHWPELPLCKVLVPAEADEPRLSHCMMALRYRGECLEDKATCDRLRAKKAATIRAAREASAWKTSSSRRLQKLKAAKRTKQSQGAATLHENREVPKSLPTGTTAAATVFVDNDAELEADKMARAAVRHKKLCIKRSEFRRARSTRDWTWGKAIEDAKPHHAARAALRARLARGVVQSHEDMPSLVYVSKLDKKVPRRKPAIAHMVLGNQAIDATYVVESDADASAAEVETSAHSRQPAKPNRAIQDSLQTAALLDTFTFVPLAESKAADASASVPLPQYTAAKKRSGCVIS